MSLFAKATLVGGAVSFLRSERGKQVVAEARRRFDTPENRAKAQQQVRRAGQQAGGLLRQVQGRRGGAAEAWR